MLLLASCLLATPAVAATTVLINANFNDKALNTPIGTGGPGVGEPIFVHPLMDVKVQSSQLPSSSLHISKPSGTNYSSVVFEFPGSFETLDGNLRIAFTVKAPSTRGNFLFRISEQGATTSNFGRLEFNTKGDIIAADAGGSSGSILRYTPNLVFKVEYVYNLDARTYNLRINDALLLENRPHGVTDLTEGVGRLSFATTPSTTWVVDDVAATQTRSVLLKADFNDKPLNVQIGAGGAGLGEPVQVSNLEARVRAAPLATPSLHLSARSTRGAGRFVLFDFLDSAKIRSGDLRIAFTARAPPVLEPLFVGIQQQGSASSAFFGFLSFGSDGTILSSSLGSPGTFVGTYAPSQTVQIEYLYRVELGVFDLSIDGVRVQNRKPHGLSDPAAAIGSLLFGTNSSTQEWVIDDILVTHTGVLVDADFNNKPLNTDVGVGGVSVGEPSKLDLYLEAKTQAAPLATPSLHLRGTSGINFQASEFQFDNGQEINSGDLRLAFTLRAPPALSSMRVGIRERVTSSRNFGTLSFTGGGTILADSAGNQTPRVVGSYVQNQILKVVYLYYTDIDAYDLSIDGVLVRNFKTHGVTDTAVGIGKILFSTNETAYEWVIDDILVTQRPRSILFANGFE